MGLGNYGSVSRDDGGTGELLAKWVKCSFIFFIFYLSVISLLSRRRTLKVIS